MTKIFSLKELELLAKKADSYSARYDIPEEIYNKMLAEQETFYEFLQQNPNCYGNKADWDKANVHNRFICYMLVIKISEFMEAKSKNE